MYEKEFVNRLSELRNQKDVSAREMSLAIGQNSSYINHIENGHILPSLSVFFNICEYLCVTPRHFFDFENPLPSGYDDFLTNVQKLSKEELASIILIVNSMTK